jgi:hypothetical protein
VLVPSRGRDAHVAHRSEYARDPSAREMGSDLDLTLLCRDGSELAGRGPGPSLPARPPK